MSLDCDPPDFYSEYFRTARKQHTCCECSVAILPGDEYVACAGKWDGDMQVFKQHLVCYHIARFVNLELFAHWPERRDSGTHHCGFEDQKTESAHAFIWHPMDCSWLVELDIPERKIQDACIGFGGIDECISYRDDHENCVDVKGYWARWLHDVHEVFAEGSGI